MEHKKNPFEKIHHLAVGLVLILKGADKISHHTLIGTLILVFGLSIIFYFLYSIRKAHEGHTLGILVHFFEALALFFTAYIYNSEGKTYIQYVVLAAGIGFFIMACISLFKEIKSKK